MELRKTWLSGVALVGLWWLLFLPSGQNWVGVVVDEGFVHHGVQRVLAGEVPHLDFFFLWTPGILWLHALAQKLTGEYLFTGRVLVVAQGLWLLWLQLRLADDLRLGFFGKILVLGLASVWGVSAWNMPYASWSAILCAWTAAWLLPKKPAVAGVFLALSFWFKQNVGIFAWIAVAVWGFWQHRLWVPEHPGGGSVGTAVSVGKSSATAVTRALGVALGGIVGGLFAFGLLGGDGALSAILRQVFLFPFTYREVMAHPLPVREMALALGVALVALSGEARSRRTRLAPYAAFALAVALFSAFVFRVGWSAAAESLFFLAVLLSPPLFLLSRRLELAAIRQETWLVLAVGVACWLQIYPRFDRAHFIFSFSAVLVPFVAAMGRVRLIWAAAWVAVILAGGLQGNWESLRGAWEGERVFGLRARGDAAGYLGEMHDVIGWLRKERGIAEGAPVLQIPVSTLFWPVSGFRNPTPHVQFFPGYVEAFGAEQSRVLAEAERAGARVVVLDRWAETERWTPELYFSLITGWRETKRFPRHFSIWERP